MAKLRDFLPLAVIMTVIILYTVAKQLFWGWNLHAAMSDFMAAFFLIFGSFKIFRLHDFAIAYATYDIIAQRSMLYAYAYPFIELALGSAYLMRWFPQLINTITLVLMLVSSIGVMKALAQKRTIPCACLGTVFKIPMTYVTLIEDLVMAGMALISFFM